MKESTVIELMQELIESREALRKLKELQKAVNTKVNTLEQIISDYLGDRDEGTMGSFRFNRGDPFVSVRTADISKVETRFLWSRVNHREVRSWFIDHGETPSGIDIQVKQGKLRIEKFGA